MLTVAQLGESAKRLTEAHKSMVEARHHQAHRQATEAIEAAQAAREGSE